MVTIGWFMLLLILILGLRLGGIAVGLLSGLGVGLLACWIQPAAPPHDLMLVQATWFLMMATLETTGFFYLLTTKLTGCLTKANYPNRLWITLLCYAVVFLTGDKKWLYQSIYPQNRLHKAQDRLAISLAVAAHMALLVSPLSISGILLILVAGNNGLPIANLMGIMGMMTVGITVLGSLLTVMIPDKWLKKLSSLLHHSSQAKDDWQLLSSSKAKVKYIFLFLLLAEILFLLITPEANQLTKLIGIEKSFPVRFPLFFALIMLSMAALAMLYGRLKPAKILQTYRFELGVQQFFIFLGLTWLFKTVMIHEKAYFLKALDGANPDYGFYLVAALYTLLIDPSMVVWLLSPLLIEFHCTIMTLAASLVLVHTLAPAGYWIRKMLNPHTKKQTNFI